MLSFDIRSLESKAAQVDASLSAADPVWVEGDPLPSQPVSVIGRLSSAGSDRFYFSGRIEGLVELACRRCLTEVSAEVADEVQILFAEAGDEDTDDPDVFHLDPRSVALDLRPAIREHWLLAVPRFVLCDENCKGLCPTCGADLNAGPCDCAAGGVAADGVLRDLATDAS